ncbi:MAG TPA: Na+/H+ antiporter subunit E [Anaerolineales bacterium]|jgi:multicomponent Na+:H+ antiporter subunit E|nr:Na+/H+ antiporter subunit E [Anaerolineales bacterium]
MLLYLSSLLVLFVIYLMLTGNGSLSNLVLGLIVAAIISLLMPKNTPMLVRIDRLPRYLWAGLQYAVVVIWDVIRGGISTARIVLDPKLPLKPGIVAIPYGKKSELGSAFSAHAITLSPGELVIEIDSEGNMYTHALNVDETLAAAEAGQAKRTRLLDVMFDS